MQSTKEQMIGYTAVTKRLEEINSGLTNRLKTYLDSGIMNRLKKLNSGIMNGLENYGIRKLRIDWRSWIQTL